MSDVIDLLHKAISKSPAEQTELVREAEEFFLTRFAENVIHQNMGRSDSTIWCRAINGRKIGIARTNELRYDSIIKTILRAHEISLLSPEDAQLTGFRKSPKASPSRGFHESTALCPPAARAEAVGKIVGIAERNALSAAGMYQTSTTSLAVVNSLGTVQEDRVAEARLSLTMTGSEGRAGFAQAFSRDVTRIDVEALAEAACRKAEKTSEPAALSPGKYTVILDPEAVADFLLFLGFLGFAGKGMVSKRSFMADKIGSRIMSELVSVYEDPDDDEMAYMPFDYEGVPRKRVALVENGIARGAVYDNYYASVMSLESTGNALQPGNSFGPYPKAMSMLPGKFPLADLISRANRAIWITHFWYLNYVNPMQTTVTGTTRDGTFLVENGKVTRRLKDMRIQQSMLEAFNNIEAVSVERRVVPKYGALMRVPTLLIKDFNCTAVV